MISLEEIKKYLPQYLFLDRINNCPIEAVSKEDIDKKRLFTLSNYGFYMFLVKLSIHFTRVREEVDRTIGYD